jgi:predicted acetyltransferase
MMDIRRVDRSQAPVVDNLLELYCHDMAEWFLVDAHEDGRYAYPAEEVWNDGVDVYLARLDRVPIGFALVGSAEPYVGDPSVKDLDEFFIVRRHRRGGLGQALATHVWNAYPGQWLVRVFQGNRPALPFWRAAIGRYTGGGYSEEERDVNGRRWSYFRFDRAG